VTPSPGRSSIAQEIDAAFATHDVAAFGALLADDVRWGDDDHPRKCRGRSDVLATFARLIAGGVDADVTETLTGRDGVMCCLRVRWPDPNDRRRGTVLYHVYLLRDGRVSEIQRYDDRPSAVAAIGPTTTRSPGPRRDRRAEHERARQRSFEDP
jgi:hypothetical protein